MMKSRYFIVAGVLRPSDEIAHKDDVDSPFNRKDDAIIEHHHSKPSKYI